MKKIIAGLFAGLILTTGAQALAYGCEGGICELPQRQNTAYCYGGDEGYCYDGNFTSEQDGDSTYRGRGGCGCWRGR